MAQVQDNTYLYRGQGQVFISARDAFGNPYGFIFVGNVSELILKPKTEAVLHRESQTGNNSVDAQFEKNLDVEISFKTCSAYKTNLTKFVYGKLTESGNTTITGENVRASKGNYAFLDYINLSSFTSLTPKSGSVPYKKDIDYSVDLATGMIQFAGDAPFADGDILKANYVSSGEEVVAAFEEINQNYWLRFNGLNTADNNKPVIVDIPNTRFQAVNEITLINDDDFNKFEQTGRALFDRYRTATNSKYSRYFTIRKAV